MIELEDDEAEGDSATSEATGPNAIITFTGALPFPPSTQLFNLLIFIFSM